MITTNLDPACKNERHAETNVILSGHYDDKPEVWHFKVLVHEEASTFMEFNNLNFCKVIDYDETFAQVFARCFTQCGSQVATNKFGEPAKDAAFKEMKQLHDRIAFNPLNVVSMTLEERRQAFESLIFI